MNERIKALETQCYVFVEGDGIDCDTSTFDDRVIFNKEKFAELIIRECAKFLDENSGYDNSNNAFHPEPEDLLKHFGIE